MSLSFYSLHFHSPRITRAISKSPHFYPQIASYKRALSLLNTLPSFLHNQIMATNQLNSVVTESSNLRKWIEITFAFEKRPKIDGNRKRMEHILDGEARWFCHVISFSRSIPFMRLT
jgi:hypothetical protein